MIAPVGEAPTQPAPDPFLMRVPTPAAFAELYAVPLGEVRYRIYYGGRGSAKSWQFARAALLLGAQRTLRILCAREYQSSVKDSVHRLLSDQIAELGLQGFYRITKTGIIGANGTRFLFKGLKKNIQEIKSTEGIDICWVEEAESVSSRSWEALVPTIRKPGSEIWVSFNPALPTDATYVRFVLKPQPRSIVRKVSYLDNPWLPQVLHEEQAALLAADPDAHAHVWGGEPWHRSEAQVLNGKCKVMAFTPAENWQGPYYGGDWGFAMDPTIIVRLWIHDRRLYLEYAEGQPQLDNDATEALIRSIPGAEEREIRADSARPETINEMVKRGLRVVPAEKGEGSVKDGIAHLRSYSDIVIHPRCKRAIEEARLWRYKVDVRTQEVLPTLQPGHDHVWDAVRYALSPLIIQPKRAKPRVLFGGGSPAA